MRLLILGHWSDTGFGLVTRRLGEEFVKRGVDVRVIALNHRGEPVKGPLAGRVWPMDTLERYFQHLGAQAIAGTLWSQLDKEDRWQPDQVLAIADMSGFQAYIGRLTGEWLRLPVWHYCPIEGDNLPLSWRDIWNRPGQDQFPDAFFRPVAMSAYGQQVIAAHIGREVPMVYHGIDTDTFHPVSASNPIEHDGKVLRSKEQCKAAFGLDPAKPLILRIDRLVVRKRYDLQLRAAAAIFENHPTAQMLMHCSPVDPPLNLYEEMGRDWDSLKGRALTSDGHDTFKGLPDSGVAALHNAADIYLSTTAGEGFGLALGEAAACGVPVVTTDYAAGPEVVGPGGILVPPLHDAYGGVVKDHSQYGMDWAVPDWQGFVEPVLTLLSKPQRRRQMGDAGRAHVKRNFSWSAAADQFIDLFDSVIPVEVAA